MEQKRKEIIINEIKYWKQTRLLPEQYCDYLLALYTEGNEHEYTKKEKRNKNFMRLLRLSLLVTICLLVPITLLVIYFTELSFVLQMLLLSLFVIICLSAVLFFAKQRAFIHIPLMIGALILLLLSVRICEWYFPGETMVLRLAITLNCLLWLFVGWRLKFLYFSISGALGLFLVLFSFFL
ncbi:hypothetical protein EDD69_108105 [Thermolongibacillus altinsuensis]|jgi:hypothetical protein|uniref:Uncharacterized protein n=1 Tax=Thermolongibacillus altinsuensis TaxID=575256 RepID=A0A4R1QED2_9BACL|nr:hypothetical protein [Thermolongibacillus altinsuensis]TCL48847.1 hypothetical protein EDD69_108105 [Thermolongibacillus altinsuensis]